MIKLLILHNVETYDSDVRVLPADSQVNPVVVVVVIVVKVNIMINFHFNSEPH